ncbi:radical SAM protein [Candidatus Alkanophaga liquidiphilum]|nr:Radical SAM superfamily maturase [Candidatus Alkanophaga liquidiphilum]
MVKALVNAALYLVKLNALRSLNRTPPPPLLVHLEVTKRCNLRCIHCAIRADVLDKSEELSIDEIESLIDSLSSLGTMYLSMSGGEPFLRKDIFDLIKYGKSRGLGLHISSNGTLITKGIAKRLNALGLDAITISLDAVTPEIHDEIRGVKGVFEKAVSAIKNLIECKRHTQVGINAIVTDLNFHELPELVDFAAELGVDGVRLQPWHAPLGHPETEDLLSVKRERLGELKKALEEALQRARRNGIYINSKAYIRGISHFFEDAETLKIDCFAGFFSCNVSWEGMVYPCAFVPPVGSVKNERFEKIWRSERFKAVRDNIKRGKCPKCWMNCFIEPSLRCSLKYAVREPLKYVSDLRYFYRSLGEFS